MAIRCVKFRAYEKNTLKGFADLELTNTGLVIHDCTWHEKDGKEWVGFPARSYTDQDGNTQWQALIEFAKDAREAREQFRKQALAAIHAVVPTEAA
jgi:hypothetical protein